MHKSVGRLFVVLLMSLGSSVATAFDYDAEREDVLAREAAIRDDITGLSEAERLNAFIELYFDYTMLEFPEYGTYIGVPGVNYRWTDNSIEVIERRKTDTRRSLLLLTEIDREQLNDADRLNYDLLMDTLQLDVDGQRFASDYLTLNQLGGVHQDVPQMLALQPKNTVGDYEDVLARLDGATTLVEQNLVLLKKGLELEVTPPQITLRDVPQQIQNLLTQDPADSALLAAFKEFPESIPVSEQDRLRARALWIYEKSLAPAYQRLHSFLVDEYLPGARDSIAAVDLPDGEAWYAHRVRRMTTTDMTPEEIHELGLSEVKRIRGEMDRVIVESGFQGSFTEFTEFLRTDPQFYFGTPEGLLTGYRDVAKRADAGLPALFGVLPRLPYGVARVPEYAEKSQTTAYYEGGSLEAGRPGLFFANAYNLKTRPKWEMEALTLHEAMPGHHLQIALAQELDMPWFRRYGGYTAFVEGWGLYSESLGEEMGFYEDPYSKFGQLTYEMWRAVRLVVDTGMHALGWSRDDAIEFFVSNSSKSRHDIVVEIDRYIVWPGQALAYKIGELKIKELRARATEALGEDFNVRTFHDTVLGAGAVPLSVLEARVDAWVAEQLPEPEPDPAIVLTEGP